MRRDSEENASLILGLRFWRPFLIPRLYCPNELLEGLFDVEVILGRRLEEPTPHVPPKFFSFTLLHLPILQITFVA